MKRTLLYLIVMCILCCFCACYTQTAHPSQETTQVTTQTAPTLPEKHPVEQISMAAISLPITTETAYSDSSNEIFKYKYQSISLTLPDPDIADKIIIDFLEQVDTTRETADKIKAAAENDVKYPNNGTPYLCQILFEPMRIDQNVLSLFGNFVTYSGTPHPESAQLSLNYDLINGNRITLRDVLTDNCTADTLADLLIESLAQKTNLYPDYEDTVRHRITTNFKHDTAWYFSTEGLCFYFAPYDIAPYSAGIVHTVIPYGKLTGILDNSYFPAELEPADGILMTSGFDKQTMEQFTQICEINIGNSEEYCLLYTDRAIYNLRICLNDNTTEQAVFLAQSLTPGDAVVLQGSTKSEILITYQSNSTQVTSRLHYDRDKQTYSLQPRA